MTKSRILAAGSLSFAVACLLAGCGGGSGRPDTFPVSGKVTYQGKPVADASVAFLAPGAPGMASGVTDAAGSFRLTTFKPDDGAVIGMHAVTVRKLSSLPTGPVAPSGDGPIDPQAIEKAMQEQSQAVMKARKTPSGLPAKYADFKTTDLKVEVGPDENVVEILLKD